MVVLLQGIQKNVRSSVNQTEERTFFGTPCSTVFDFLVVFLFNARRAEGHFKRENDGDNARSQGLSHPSEETGIRGQMSAGV